MVKILGGVVAAIMVAVGGFFGFEFYVQHRIVTEIDGVFEQIRASGGKASQSWNPRARPVSPGPPPCQAPCAALNHSTPPADRTPVAPVESS